MRFLDEWNDVLITLNTQRFRTFLTLFGIILGVGTLVFFSSLLAGMGKFMEAKLQEASGEDIITLSKRWEDEMPQNRNKQGIPLNRFDSKALSEAPHLQNGMVLNRYATRIPYGTRWGQHIWAIGTTPKAQSFYGIAVETGRFLNDHDIESASQVAILGPLAAKKLLPNEDNPIGKEIKLKGIRFRIVGILKSKPSIGTGMWTWNESAVIGESAFALRIARSKEIQEIVIKSPQAELTDYGLSYLAQIAKSTVVARHHGIQNFRITDPVKDAESKKISLLVVGGLQWAIAGVCLLVGGINIMNIMLVTVSQRTREIGIRMAIGATKASVQRQFLTEAALLAGVGGVLGVAGGALFAWALSGILTLALGPWPFIFLPIQALLGFASALFTGVAFGWYPARRAASLSPIIALRHE